MRTVFIPMLPHNTELVVNAKKVTTLRTASSAKKIGMATGEVCKCYFGSKPFIVACAGEMTVEEAGGKEEMWESEGFNHTGGPMFDVVKDWLEGKGKLYLYGLMPIEE